MKSFEIRKMWLDFFASKKHYIEKSFSLIPHKDSTLLWVNAGVTPLKKYFDGTQVPACCRIANIQKCIRTNDIDNVGHTSRHHTFFEMLGNFSIGDYFKKEAIHFAYELLTSSQWFALSLDKIYITYFPTDKDTYQYWVDLGVKKEHLIPLKTNFWKIGVGPSGPCTEIFFDRGIKYDLRHKELIIEGIENDRFIEIWNVVFSQYNCDPNIPMEQYPELPSKNIDTGAGLERFATILQNTNSNFETDLFLPLIKALEQLSQVTYQGQTSFKVIADHLKTLVFAINDGAVLTNEKRGYVLKKLLRKAVNQGKKINLHCPFLHKLVPATVNMMCDFYPELVQNQDMIIKILLQQEHIFGETLKTAEARFLQYVYQKHLSGSNFFKLYDTYGIPEDLIIATAQKHYVTFDHLEFKKLLEQHQKMSKKKKLFMADMNQQEEKFLNFKEKSEFVGYHQGHTVTKVIRVFDQGIVLLQTPFYAPMGGQIADDGFINGVLVTNIVKLPNGQFLHEVEGYFHEGQEVVAQIDQNKREQISYHHTATHLLEEVLRQTLGKHVEKQGSWVGFDSLRYDFNHFEKITAETLIKIEQRINHQINERLGVQIEELFLPEAQMRYSSLLEKNQKAKYYNKIRIVKIGPDFIDLCGGTHAKNTYALNRFAILSCETISSGVYRIEAVCGAHLDQKIAHKLLSYQKSQQDLIKKAQKNEIPGVIFDIPVSPKIQQSYQDIVNAQQYVKLLQQKLLLFEKIILRYHQNKLIQEKDRFLPDHITKELFVIIEETKPIEALKYFVNYLFDSLQLEVLFLCYVTSEKVVFLCKSKTIHAGQLVKKVSLLALGAGGGSPFLGQGGTKITKNMNQVMKFLKEKFYIF
ncbi:alanine--tRNA ligase ['Fragaria x ananassa' phyllody phytoplasma]|uniref:Alanine--tRNA ligase n=1 Tax='Fragaria x ananassa' phyllody phytoplasma TaxID=2358428 RepID=A0ABS5K324_9MOLU|nr:alanine--tRNA ligase ['Fragaria x ananassa' phyllody phytoplasma]MBS2126286.1 alanine--tRNA ligase ['Fragaria x ananassa' phyllody phytoplasma]